MQNSNFILTSNYTPVDMSSKYQVNEINYDYENRLVTSENWDAIFGITKDITKDDFDKGYSFTSIDLSTRTAIEQEPEPETITRIYVDVQYHQKERAKLYGAMYGGQQNGWYVMGTTETAHWFYYKMTGTVDAQRRIEDKHRAIRHNDNADITIPDYDYQQRLSDEIDVLAKQVPIQIARMKELDNIYSQQVQVIKPKSQYKEFSLNDFF